ncbi:MAG: PEGA domain-containing protein [Candidatus Dojkabacteria bacterium]|nr:PEGA domain-containing protein [Candidatus Dojkabacteria bacterium]
MKKKKKRNGKAVLASILVTLTIYTGALLIFLYVKGWRIDFIDQSIKKIGVLTVESSPMLAEIYVNDEYKGKTNKSMTLDIGDYDVMVSKEGYFDWNKEVSILEEKSTPVYPYLIKSEFKEENIYTSDTPIEKSWVDSDNNHFMFMTETEDSFKLYYYNPNPSFLSISSLPVNILTIPINNEENTISDVNIKLSPSGDLAILKISEEDSKDPSRFIIPTTTEISYNSLSNYSINLNDFEDFQITWAENEKYLILESDSEVISYSLNKGTKQLLLRKTDSLDKWTTDSDGYFYIFRHIENEDETIIEYSLKQYNLDGSGEVEVISSLYLQNDTTFIDQYRSTDFAFGFFTNSPENTQTIGEITNFAVNQDVDGIFIKTTEASYWYDMTIGKYITISPYPVDIVEFSPDEDKLLIKTPTEYQIFVFDKEEGDHTITIGTHYIENINIDQITQINWLSNSSYIQYAEDNFIYIADKEGENKTPILSSEDVLYWTVRNSRDKLITIVNTEEGFTITSYLIH